MCPVCAITTKLSDVLATLRNKRKRQRIFKKMQARASKTHTPVISAGIETYNYRGE